MQIRLDMNAIQQSINFSLNYSTWNHDLQGNDVGHPRMVSVYNILLSYEYDLHYVQFHRRQYFSLLVVSEIRNVSGRKI